jgi:hypothetical protein
MNRRSFVSYLPAWICLNIFCTFTVFAADPTAVWSSIEKPTADPARIAVVRQLVFTHDRIRITLEDGVLQYSQPVEGQVVAAAFRGKGSLQVIPPNSLELQQLRLLTGDDKVELSFTEAAFYSTDSTFTIAQLSAQLQRGAPADPRLAELMTARLKDGDEYGAGVTSRLFKGVLSGNHPRTAFFLADMKTDKHGWVQARYDALKIEEIRVGRWANVEVGRHFDTWMEFPADGRNPFLAFQDPLAREDYDIRGYQIDATVGDNAELHATARVDLLYRADQEHVITFNLDANLRVDSVKNSKGDALGFVQPREPKDRVSTYGEYLIVILPAGTHAGAGEKLEFHYGGKRVIQKVGAGNFFCESLGWYPAVQETFAARSNFEMTFNSPKKYTLVATGSKTDETTDGNQSITTWKSDMPQAVAGFAFGDYKIVTTRVGDTEVTIYANKSADENLEAIQARTNGTMGSQGVIVGGTALGTLTPAAMANSMATEVGNTIKVFEQYYGPFPFKHLSVTNIPYSYGQGWPTLLYLSVLSFLDSTQRHQLLPNNNDVRITDFFRAHETSHQWWGHRVGWKSYHDQWLSEGFAQFSGNLYVQYRENFQEYLKRLRADKFDLGKRDLKNRTLESIGPVWMGRRLSNSDARGAYSTVVYNKGGYVLHMLRMMMWDARAPAPDHRFIEMMKDFTTTYDNKPASTEDFKAIAEKHMIKEMELEPGRGLTWFFRQYIYNTGIPQYQFSHKIEPAEGGKYRITGTLTRSGVPDGWMDLIPLYVQFGGGKSARLGVIPALRSTTVLDSVVAMPQRPEKIVVNMNEDILADVKQ